MQRLVTSDKINTGVLPLTEAGETVSIKLHKRTQREVQLPPRSIYGVIDDHVPTCSRSWSATWAYMRSLQVNIDEVIGAHSAGMCVQGARRPTFITTRCGFGTPPLDPHDTGRLNEARTHATLRLAQGGENP